MYVIVMGGGNVGRHLTKSLLAEGHEVVLIEENKGMAADLADELGESVAVQGDGTEAAVLASIGTHRADVFVAVTGEDPGNLVACQVAKAKFHVPRTIARVNDPKNER